MSSDLVKIKEKYGERMMHLCRKSFSTILETEGLLFGLISSHFAYSKFLYEDIEKNSLKNMFVNYIYYLAFPEIEELLEVSKTPSELLDDAGYVLYECKTEDDIQSFRKYYTSGEELCSFRGNRLDECYVFFAVKKDALYIDRKKFINPLRQDLYGTSVISIQFTRGNVNILSIKNRYNHKVDDSDATFSNNLENIIPGLTRSFERDYNLNINQNDSGGFEIPGYVKTKDGKYYKYNYEINNIYYCPDNIIIDNFKVVRDYQEKEKFIIIDYFIIDLVNKKISLYDQTICDSFIDGLENIAKIDIIKDSDTKKLNIAFLDGSYAYVEIDKYNRIISYNNENITSVGEYFLHENRYLEEIDMPNVYTIGNGFLNSNMLLKELYFNKLVRVGDGFLSSNQCINRLELGNLITVGCNFLSNNDSLISVTMPNLEIVGNNFLLTSRLLEEIYFPKLICVGDKFLAFNKFLKRVSLPCLNSVGNNFIAANKIIEEIDMPCLGEAGDNFLYSNLVMKRLELDNLDFVGNNFMYCNRMLEEVKLSRLMSVGMKFLYMNNSIVRLELLQLLHAGRYFMYNNNSLRILLVPKLIMVERGFLKVNNVLEYVDVDFDLLDGSINCFERMNIDVKRRKLCI